MLAWEFSGLVWVGSRVTLSGVKIRLVSLGSSTLVVRRDRPENGAAPGVIARDLPLVRRYWGHCLRVGEAVMGGGGTVTTVLWHRRTIISAGNVRLLWSVRNVGGARVLGLLGREWSL